MFSLDSFLKPLSSTDTNIQILENLDVKWTINPFMIKNIYVFNNLIKISLESGREIVIDFRSSNESKQALVKLQYNIDILKNKNPIHMDKMIEEFIGGLNIETGQFTPSDPSPTTSTIGVMMGLGVSITPIRSGKVLIILSGDTDNDTNSRGVTLQLRYGTGTPPTNGSSLSGISTGSSPTFFQSSNVQRTLFNLNSIVSGLSLNTTIWIDISIASSGGSGTARVRNISASVIEL